MDVLLTIDIGTTSVKTALVSRAGVDSTVTREYPTRSPHPGWFEQSQREVIDTAFGAAAEVIAACPNGSVAGIGLTGHMNGLSAVAADGEPLYPHILHSDLRAQGCLTQIKAVIGQREHYLLTGNRVDVHSGLPKILWLRENHPDIYSQSARFLNIKDVVRGALTGDYGATDASDASLFNALDIVNRRWADGLLRDLGIPFEKMPEILPAHDTSSRLCAPAAARLGLPSGLPVAVGGGDGACACAGAGVTRPGGAYANIGSTAWVSALLKRPYDDPDMRAFHYSDLSGDYIGLCGTVQSGAASLEFVARALDLDIRTLCALSHTSPPGANGVFFLPYISGERTPHWDVSASGAFVGLRASHTRADMARAALEGVAHALCDCCDAITDAMVGSGDGLPPFLTLIGGVAGADIIPRLIADALGLPVRRHARASHATSLGAAMAAGVGVGMFATYDEAAALALSGDPFPHEPNSPLRAARTTWKTLYPAMKAVYEQLSMGDEGTASSPYP